MKDILPDTQKSPTPKSVNLRKIGTIGLLLGAMLLAGLLYGVFRAVPNLVGGSNISALKVGKMSALEVLPNPPPQPIETFKGPNGADIQLSAFKGKVILVNLWATWCAPCVTEMPTLAGLQSHINNKDFLVVAVSVDRQNEKEAAKVELSKLSKGVLTFYHDPKMAIVYPMRARGFPTSVLYDREGKEVARLAGEADWNSPEAHAVIQSALTQK
jgi:thiol-disulfide isomerase/thioredoxin